MYFFRAPTDCVQWFTGTTGAVKSYNFAGSQLLQSQYYTNCIRTEQGYCSIQWKESSSTSPDPFGVGSTITAIESDGCDGLNGFILIPNLSQDGIQKLPIPVSTTYAYQSQVCGSNFGIEGMGTISQPLISKWFNKTTYNKINSEKSHMFMIMFPSARQQPFILGVYTAQTGMPGATGFNLDYTQVTTI